MGPNDERISEASGRLEIMVYVGDAINKELMDSAACYVLDCTSTVFVWCGMYSSMSERSWALLKAEELVSHGLRPSCADISWVVDSYEGTLFKDNFIGWEDRSWDIQEVNAEDNAKANNKVDILLCCLLVKGNRQRGCTTTLPSRFPCNRSFGL
jgi:hypothetical protein